MYYVYLLYDGKRFYIGYTKDLRRRLAEHKLGKVESTRYRKNLELVFYEAFKSKADALRRGKYFKTTKGKRSLKLMMKETLESY